MGVMSANGTLLCIQRNPSKLQFLTQSGFDVLTAADGHEGLRIFMTQPVDAIVLEYHLGFLDGGVVAAEIKKVCPRIPIVMLINDLEVPDGALKSVDMVVAEFDGDHFLLSAVHSVMEASRVPKSQRSTPIATMYPSHDDRRVSLPFTPEEWQSILSGAVKFGSDA